MIELVLAEMRKILWGTKAGGQGAGQGMWRGAGRGLDWGDEDEAVRESDDEEARLLPELWDMHVLKQKSGAAMGGAVFSDHQDRHAETKYV